MSNREALDDLKDLIHHSFSDIENVVRADIDEMAVLSDLCKALLPSRFLEVIKSLDSYFVLGDNSSNLDYLERLNRIIEVSEKYPSVLAASETSEGLLPTFVLIKEDKDRVLTLCQEMRGIVFDSNFFDEPHKRRLLNRIAAIESQVFQPRGLFDVVRGGINDVGETLGKFGTDIKPLTDRMTEVVKLVRKSTKEYDQLPPPDDVKQLPPPDKDE